MRILLTDLILSNLRVPEDKSRITISDVACPGLSIELRKPGRSSWRMRYSFQRVQEFITLGNGREMSLDEARQLGFLVKKLALSNQDPSLELKKIQIKAKLTFALFVDKFYLPHIRSYKRCVSADLTLLNNHLLPAFGMQVMGSISRYQVVEFLQEKVAAGFKPGYCNRFLVLLGFCFNLALKWEIPGVKQNPVKGVSLLKNSIRSERYLQAFEIQRLLTALDESANPLLRYFVPMALLTGARKRELLDARWCDIDLDRRIWRIPMTKSGRALIIPLTNEVVVLLNELKGKLNLMLGDRSGDQCQWIFPNPKTGKPFASIYHCWNTARIKAGLSDLRIHDLRHSFASALVNQGVPIYDVQKLLGHQSVKTTERYSHLAPDRLRSSAGAASAFYSKLVSSITERH